MAGILQYSGISTKIKAMHSKLLSPGGYEQLINCESIENALQYLKKHPEYGVALKNIDESNSHREAIEAALTASLYSDYNRLYSFAKGGQRDFMEFYFLHYEVMFLKKYLRRAYVGSSHEISSESEISFIERHSRLNVKALIASESMNEFIEALAGTIYYELFKHISMTDSTSLYDYEVSMDIYYFSTIWKKKNKILSGDALKLITDMYGQRIDLINIQWLLRSKKNYRMTKSELYAMVIPCYYHIKPADITRIVETDDYEEAVRAMLDTYYGKRYGESFNEISQVENMYTSLIEQIYNAASSKNPYSIAPINSFLYMKEHEIHRITSILEGLRYGVSASKLAVYAGNS